jgi:hypothetical protein
MILKDTILIIRNYFLFCSLFLTTAGPFYSIKTILHETEEKGVRDLATLFLLIVTNTQ